MKNRNSVTKEKLVEALSKATKMAILESKDSGVGAYAEKVDKLVEEMIDKLDKLAQEGEELTRDNPTHDYAVQERNHLVMARVGILKALKGRLVQVIEDLYRNV
jgi:NAD dependent epimerase/dehydratase family enzyme